MSTEAIAAVSTPAAASAPAAPPATAPVPAAPPSATRPKPTAEAPKVTTRRTYQTGSVRGGAQLATVQAAANATRGAPAPVAVPAAAVTAPAAPVVAAPLAALASAVAPPSDAAPTLEGVTATEPAGEVAAVVDTPATDETPKLDNREFARRFGQLARAEKKIATERQTFAAEKQQHAAALARVADVDRFGEHLRRDPLGSLKRVFNVDPHIILDAIMQADAAKKSPAGQPASAAAPSPTEDRIAALEQQLKDAATKTTEQQQRAQVQSYISDNVVPLLADKTKFAFVNHKFGADAPTMIYNTMYARFQKTGTPPRPAEVATFIESELRREAQEAAKLLAPGAGSAQIASPVQVATPPAKPKVAAQPQPVVAARPRNRTVPSAYTSKARG